MLLGLAAVAYWAYMQSNRGGGVAVQEPAPDSLPDITAPVDVSPPEQPDVADAMMLIQEGNRQFSAGAYDSARVNYALAVQISPDNGDYRRNLGLALRELGNDEEALQHFRRAVDLDPTLIVARFDYAAALLATGDTVTALEEFEQFANQSYGNENLVVLRYQALQIVRRIRRAQEAAEASRDTGRLPPLPVPDSITPIVPASGDI